MPKNTTENGWEERFEEKLKTWLETEEHRYNCTACSEGQYCCLDAEHPSFKRIFSFIQHIANEEYERGRHEMKRDILKFLRETPNPYMVEATLERLVTDVAALETPNTETV